MLELLKPIFEKYNFQPFNSRGVWSVINLRDDNCEHIIYIHILSDGETARLCVSNDDCEFYDSVHLFETQDTNDISKLLEIVLHRDPLKF